MSPARARRSEPMLVVDALSVRFGRSAAPVVNGIGFELMPGQRLGLIGESGSGKSVTALAIMGLLSPEAQISGSIQLHGRELIGLKDAEFSRIRGEQLTMIFQEPMTALDPTMTVGRQVAEVLRLHHARVREAAARQAEFAPLNVGARAMLEPPPTSGDARSRVLQILAEVGLGDPERVATSYPHQLSGGQRQRCLIAMALINCPELVICDEPTTALDVTVQATVLTLLDSELDVVGAGCLFISHDLAVVSQVCDQLLVMYRGQLVESGSVDEVLGHPRHPYTKGLVAIARIDKVTPGQRLPVLEDYLQDGAYA